MDTEPTDGPTPGDDPAAAGSSAGRRARRQVRRLAAAPEPIARAGERSLGKLIAETALLADGVIQQRQRDRDVVHPVRSRGRSLFGFFRSH